MQNACSNKILDKFTAAYVIYQKDFTIILHPKYLFQMPDEFYKDPLNIQTLYLIQLSLG